MAERSEVLGIKLKINIDGDFGKLLKTIEDSLKKINVGKLEKDFQNLKQTVATMQQTMKGMSGDSSSGLKKLVAEAAKFGIHLSEADIALARTHKRIAAAANETEEWVHGSERLNGKYMSLEKALKTIAAEEAKAAREAKKRADEEAKAAKQRENSARMYARLFDEVSRKEKAAVKEQWDAQAKLQRQREQHIKDNIRALNEQRRIALQSIADEERERRRIMRAQTDSAIRQGMASPIGSRRQVQDRTILDGWNIGTMAKRLAEFYLLRSAMFGIANQIGDAKDQLISLNQALHDTAAISGASVQSMTALKNVALEMAAASRFSVTEVMNVMKVLAQAGVAAKDLPRVAQSTVMFATGAGANAAQSVDLMTTAMNVWGIKAEESMRVTNSLTAALNASKLEAGQLGTVMNYLGNQADQMGMSLEETLGIVAAFANKGVKASTIGTGVSSLLTDLAAPKPRFAALLKEYGVSLNEVNPMMNDFATIIQRIGEAGIPTDRILASMDKRIGRALITSLNIGSEGFKLMERAVTGTDAALIAYYKSMGGAQAKMNQLKAEFVKAMESMQAALEPLIGGGFKLLMNLVVGLQSDSGKLVVALSALSAAMVILAINIRGVGTAWAWVKKINPEIAILTGAIALATVAITAMGNAKRKQKDADAAWLRSLGEISSKLQEGEMALIGFIGTLDKAGKAKIAYNDLNGAQQEELAKLSREYPEYLGKLAEEKNIVEALTKAIDEMHAARIRNSSQIAGSYNAKSMENYRSEQALKANPEFAKVVQAARALGFSNLSDTKAVVEATAAVQANPGAYKDENSKGMLRWAQTNPAMGPFLKSFRYNSQQMDTEAATASGYRVDMLKNGHTFLVKIDPPSHTKIAGDQGDSGKDLDKPPKPEVGKNVIEDLKQALIGTQADIVEMQVREAQKTFKRKDATDADRKAAYDEGIALIEKQSRLELDREISEWKQRFSKSTPADQKKYEGDFEKLLRDLAALSKDRLGESKDAFHQATYGGYQRKDLTVNYKGKEALIDKGVAADVRALESTKADASSAAQVRDIEVAIADTRLKGLLSKREMLQAVVEEYAALTDISATEQSHYAEVKERLEQITDELQTQQRIVAQTAGSEDFWQNFVLGAKAGVRAMGDFQSITQSFGSTVVSMIGEGFPNAIMNMIEALGAGENAWKAFRASMGQILMDLGKELIKYQLKLMMVWVMQQAIGIAVSSKAGNTGILGSQQMDKFNAAMDLRVPAATGGYVLTGHGGIRRFADGGFLPHNIGVPNQDSVPAMLMPGEFVIKKAAVEHYGLNTFFKMNAMRFADGGIVPGGTSLGSSEEGQGQDLTLNIINVVDPRSVPKTTATEILNVIRMDAESNGAVTRTIKARINGQM